MAASYDDFPDLDVKQQDPTDAVAARLARRNLLDVVESVADLTGISVRDILGRGRRSEVAYARHRVWWVLHMEHGLSMADIGRLFGRDHTTVVAAIHKAYRGDPLHPRRARGRAA